VRAPGYRVGGRWGGNQDVFSKERFLALLQRPALSATELIQRIQNDLFDHINDAPQFDDITMIAVHRKPQ